MLYDDGRIACDETGLRIRTYHVWGGAKHIPYSAIRGVSQLALGGVTGRWRIWGTGDFEHWWNFDPGRPKKSTALVIDLGKRVKPTITPDDPAAVEAILARHGVG